MENSPQKIRLARLQESLKENALDSVLITGPENRRYYSGFTGSNGWLFITRTGAFIITDGRYLLQAPAEAPHFQMAATRPGEGKSLLTALKRVADENPGVKTIGFEAGVLPVDMYDDLRNTLPGVELVKSDPMIISPRMVKDEGEIQMVRQAARIAGEAYLQELPRIAPGMTEREFAARLDFAVRMKGAQKEAFDTIIASGENGACPHAQPSGRELKEGDAVTIDWGASLNGYNSDCTRTVFVGKPDPEMARIYDVVFRAQAKALEIAGPGLTAEEVDAAARQVIEKAGYGEYFTHGLGHGIGLAVHEGPTLNRNQPTVLKPGMLVTIEPGIYVSGKGGVRIEDLILITGNGKEFLTDVPKTAL
jgi:Xaa-Pro aminopeptidase